MKLNTIQARKKILSRFHVTSWCIAVIATFACVQFEAYYWAIFLNIVFLIMPILAYLCFDSGNEANGNDIVQILQRAKDNNIELGALRQEAINALIRGDTPNQLWNLYWRIESYIDNKIDERNTQAFEEQARKKRQAAYKSALEQIK